MNTKKIQIWLLSKMALIALLISIIIPANFALADGNYTIDFSTVTVNATKQAAFTTEINGIFNNLKSSISSLGTSAITAIKVVTPAAIQQVCPSNQDFTTLGCFEPDNGQLLINSDTFGDTQSAKTTIAHEMLHSFVPSGNEGSAYAAYNEMLTEHYAQELYPSSPVAYDWLETYIPTLDSILTAANVSNPDQFLAQAMYGGSITVLNDKIGPFLTSPDFVDALAAYINIDPTKTNAAGATTYLSAVLAKVQSGQTTGSGTGSAGSGTGSTGTGTGTTGTTGGTGSTSGTGTVATGSNGATASFLGLSGNFIYPPCLRSGAAQNATLSCVQESISYYTGILFVLIAIGAFFYLLYGAFLYVSAFGDESKVKQAKQVIQYAIIGMVIAMLASLAVALVKSLLNA